MYAISFNPEQSTLLIISRGFWSLATVVAFSTELLARIAAIRWQYGEFAVLVDAREAPIQPKEVIERLELLMPKALKFSSLPVAVVAGSYLGKLQTERYLKGGNCRAFLEIQQAKDWIDAERRISA